MTKENTREWASGAYRDTNDDKLDYEAFYSPLVVREFARYMHKHRKQADGKLREGDNWQGLFGSPKEHRKVCMKSLWRHFLDLWMLHRGYPVEGVTKKELLCAILFNAQAYLFSILIEEQAEKKLPPITGLFDCPVVEGSDGDRTFMIEDEFLGEVPVHSKSVKGEGYLCEITELKNKECSKQATRRMVYMYEGTQVTTYRCDYHETMPIQREEAGE